MGFANTVQVLSTVLGIFGFCFGCLAWYAGSVRKAYAAERDFNQLQITHEEIKQSLKSLGEKFDQKFEMNKLELDDIELQLLEIKSLGNVILIKISGESTLGTSNK